MDLNHVDNAIVENYRKLRTRIGVIAFLFPVVLILAGLRWGLQVQPTLSDYYFAMDPVGDRIDAFPVRLWFCGILFAVGIFLYKYQGFSENENRWLSLAGLFALGVAVFPMSHLGKSDYDPLMKWIGLPGLSLHGISAVLAFLCIAVVIFWYADSTLAELRDEKPDVYWRFKRAYVLIALYMIVSIGISMALHYLRDAHDGKDIYILLAEGSGIWAFALYWFVKNWELTEVAKVLKARKNQPMPQKTMADLADKL